MAAATCMSRRRNQALPFSAGSLIDTRKEYFFAAAVILLVTVVTYTGVIGNDFVNFDDPGHLDLNPYFQPVSWQGLGRIWSEPYFNEYVPLTYTFLAAESLLATPSSPPPSGSRFDPTVFHAGSMALHVACVWLVFLLLRRIVQRTDAALIGALFFSLHPLQVESVAWVSETRGLLATFWSLLAIGSFLSFAGLPGNFSVAGKDGKRSRVSTANMGIANPGKQTREASATAISGDPGRRRRLTYAFGTCCLILALLSKPSAVVAPLLAGILCWSYAKLDWRKLLIGLFPWLLIAGGFTLLTKLAQRNEDIAYITPLWARPLIAGDALTFYLGKTLWPESLGMQYDLAPAVVMRSYRMYFVWMVPTLLIALVLSLKQLRPYWPAVLLWIVGLAPVLGLVPFAFQNFSTVADRYMYLPLLGAALAISWWIAGGRGMTRAALPAVLLVPLSVMSFLQVKVWHDSPVLYTHTIQVNPKAWMAYLNRATWKRDRALAAINSGRSLTDVAPVLASAMGDLDQAEKFYTLGAQPDIQLHRAYIHKLRGERMPAFQEYGRAIQAAPRNHLAWYYRGIAYEEFQEYKPAIADLSQAISLNPEFAEAYLYRGEAYRKSGNSKEAVEDFSQFIQLRPANPTGYSSRAETEADEQPDRAISDLTQALNLSGDVRLCQRRAQLFARIGQLDRARADLTMLRRAGISPDPEVLRAVEQATP